MTADISAGWATVIAGFGSAFVAGLFSLVLFTVQRRRIGSSDNPTEESIAGQLGLALEHAERCDEQLAELGAAYDDLFDMWSDLDELVRDTLVHGFAGAHNPPPRRKVPRPTDRDDEPG